MHISAPTSPPKRKERVLGFRVLRRVLGFLGFRVLGRVLGFLGFRVLGF